MKLAERPNRIPWPPIIYLTAAACSLAAHQLMPFDIPLLTTSASGRILGVLLMVFGAILDITSVITMWRANTNILPNRGADELLTTGLFRYSRNPIYTGNTLLLAGAAGVFQIGWFVVLAVFSAIVVYFLAIKREEAHLALKFGTAWDEYAAKTPRWLGY